MINGFTDVPVSVFFELDADKRTRGHSMKLSKPIAVPISDYISFCQELSTAGTVHLKRPSMHHQSTPSRESLHQKKMGFFVDTWSA